jgi:hypothetical protein
MEIGENTARIWLQVHCLVAFGQPHNKAIDGLSE